ncbi:MAG TPA: ABC transporter ATP-binding protein [Chitinophagaceae bacterium]|nr:ABC transporter ATP-binding protein [Chitinophagaceae bacterium]
MNAIIEVDGLFKKFGAVQAVSDLSFSVQKGQVYGFLGQNGAGKSTTIRMLLTLIQPSSGSIQLFGLNLQKHRKKILQQVGAIIEKPDLYNYLTALQNLKLMATLSGVQPTNNQLLQQLETVGIAGRANSTVKTFSQGMKQRLGIACELVHNPGLVILDEPTNGLDPQGIADMRNLVLNLTRAEGKTVFVSSHLLSEIELMADAMLIIDKGRKVAEGALSELLDPAKTVVTIQTPDVAKAAQLLQNGKWGFEKVTPTGVQLRLHRDAIPLVNKYLIESGVAVSALTPRHSLEDYFLSLTSANQHVVPVEA